MTERYLEDFAIGQTFGSGKVRIDKERAKAFAAEFDPQPFHLDEEAARSTIFQGLAASGWHTAAVTMRQCRAEATTLAANHGYPITTRNYGFARERGHSNNMSWHPAPRTSELAQLPTRQQRPRYFCACSQPAESYIGVLGIH